MKHVNIRIILSMVIVGVFLLGSLVTPVAALQSVIIEQEMNKAYPPGANNHTYIYTSAEDLLLQSSYSRLHLNDDTDYARYYYDSTGWQINDYSYSSPANIPINWAAFSSWSNGAYGNPGLFPTFYDFIGSDGSGVAVNTTLERRVFSLAFGQHTAVIMDAQYLYFGTLVISGQEFVHITVSCLQDDIDWGVIVYDPQGREMIDMEGNEGDILVMPFRPSVAGTYYVILRAEPDTAKFAHFDFYPEAIAPRVLSSSEVVSDTLPTGEILVHEQTGSFVHQELAPTTHTYKVIPNSDVSSLHYAFNYPEFAIAITQPFYILIQSDGFYHYYMGGARYITEISSPSTGIVNFGGNVFYVTIVGGDNIAYTLYHENDVADDLPLNHEFLLENYYSNSVIVPYSLVLDSPSILAVNSTGAPSAYSIRIFGYDENGYFVQQNPTDASMIFDAIPVYLPPGEYIVEITVATAVSEMIEFTVGEIVSETTTDVLYFGGFIVPTIPAHRYNLTLTLNNHYNVSSQIVAAVYDQFYTSRWTNTFTMGTWFDGSEAIPHSTHPSEVSYLLNNRYWSDEYAIVTLEVYPYNNTLGPGEFYIDYALSFTIDWEDVTYFDYDETIELDVSDAAKSHNFTLPFPGDGVQEFYALILNTTPGVWYNVSVKTNDVASISWFTLMTPYDHRTHNIPWADLDDTLVGAVPALSIQFGAISDRAYLDLRANRALAEEGFLWIEITPMLTHQLELLPAPPSGSDLLAILASLALPIGIGVAVVVVAVVIYVKKFK